MTHVIVQPYDATQMHLMSGLGAQAGYWLHPPKWSEASEKRSDQ